MSAKAKRAQAPKVWRGWEWLLDDGSLFVTHERAHRDNAAVVSCRRVEVRAVDAAPVAPDKETP